MSNEIFTTLLQRQIDMFVSTFQDDAESLFKNEHNSLIHPGEYGMYRERCFCSLLQSVLTRDCSVSDGFIFSASCEHPTTQCDILIKNALSMPLTDSGIAKFHPVEDIYAVVEMKSNLSKSELTDTLRKMAEVKKVGDDRTTRLEYQESTPSLYDAIPTFLVCNRLAFDGIDALDFHAIYDGIDRKYWHNAILSVEDGLFLYRFRTADLPDYVASMLEGIIPPAPDMDVAWMCPQLTGQVDDKPVVYDCAPSYIKAQPEKKYMHIMRFLSVLTQAIKISEKYQFDSMQYLNS